MIISEGSYVPETTTTAAPTAISVGDATRVKRKFSTASDVAGISAGLVDMVNAMMSVQPSQMRVNGKTVSPPGKRWHAR